MQQIVAMVKHWDGDLKKNSLCPAGVNISVHDCVPLSPNDWVMGRLCGKPESGETRYLCTPATALDLFQLAI